MGSIDFQFLKKHIVTSVLLAGCISLLAGCTTQVQGQDQCRIHLTVEGVTSGTCILGGIYGKQNYRIDTAVVSADGVIRIERERFLPGMYYVLLPDQKNFVQLLIDEDQDFTLKTSLKNLVGNMEVTGSVDNELFYEDLRWERALEKRRQPIRNQLNNTPTNSGKRALHGQLDALNREQAERIKALKESNPESFFTAFKLAGKNPIMQRHYLANDQPDDARQVYQYRQDFWDGFDFSDGRLIRTPVFHNKLNRYISRLTPQNGDSLVKYADWVTRQSLANEELFKYATNFIAIKYKDGTLMDWEKVYVHMVENFFVPEYATWADSVELWRLQEQIKPMKPSLLGKKGKNITCFTETGASLSLFDLEAPIIVLFMYTTECDHCREQTPKLKKVYEEWKDKGVDVYGLCIDEDETAWKAFVQEFGLSWHNVIDTKRSSRFGNKYHVDHTPEMYVLNKDRVIVGKNLKADQLPTIFERIMAP